MIIIIIKAGNKDNHIAKLLQSHRCWEPSQKACAVLSVSGVSTILTCYLYTWHTIGTNGVYLSDVQFPAAISAQSALICGYSSNIRLAGIPTR